MSWVAIIILVLVGLVVFARSNIAGSFSNGLNNVFDSTNINALAVALASSSSTTKYKRGMSYTPSLNCSTVPSGAKNFNVPTTTACPGFFYLLRDCYNNAQGDAQKLCICAKHSGCPKATQNNEA